VYVCMYVCITQESEIVISLQSLPNSEVTMLAMKSLKKDVDIYLADEVLESKLREFQVCMYVCMYVYMYVCMR
jgi:hypothetical protein